MSSDPNACMCGCWLLAHMRGNRMGRCTGCHCTGFVMFHATPEQDQADAVQVRMFELERALAVSASVAASGVADI